MDYLINGIKIKTPHTFQIERFKLSKSGRLASGLMVMDIISKKKKFMLHYDVISGPDLTVILNLLDSDVAFYNFQFVEIGAPVTYIVYPGAIKYDRFRNDGRTYWKNVNFDLIQQ